MLSVIHFSSHTDVRFFLRAINQRTLSDALIAALCVFVCLQCLHMLHWHLVFPLSCVCFPYKGVCAFKASLDSALCVCVCVCVCVVFNRCRAELHYAHVSTH